MRGRDFLLRFFGISEPVADLYAMARELDERRAAMAACPVCSRPVTERPVWGGTGTECDCSRALEGKPYKEEK